MLEKISWGTYWLVIIVGAAIYYLSLVILYYQKGVFTKNQVKTIPSERDGNKTFTPQQNLFGFEDPATATQDQNKPQLPVDDKLLMPLVHDLIQELKEFITNISERSYVKEEVIMGIQVIINNYKKLQGSPYQKSIGDFINIECEDYCSIHLSEEDIKRIWIG